MSAYCEKINPSNPETPLIQKAVSLLASGEAVAFPTETVYGLGGDAFSEKAVEAIYHIKGRPPEKPLPVMISDFTMIYQLASAIPESAQELMNAFWPGPLTLILPAKPSVSPQITGGKRTIGVRFPKHAVPIGLIQTLRRPIVAPSANLSGRPAPTTAEGVRIQLINKISLILDGGKCSQGKESTIVDCTVNPAQIIRVGALSNEDIASVIQL